MEAVANQRTFQLISPCVNDDIYESSSQSYNYPFLSSSKLILDILFLFGFSLSSTSFNNSVHFLLFLNRKWIFQCWSNDLLCFVLKSMILHIIKVTQQIWYKREVFISSKEEVKKVTCYGTLIIVAPCEG